MDRLTSMAVFVKAVDLGSFAAAADALGITGPMIGKHVRFLEERLGTRLLNRTTRRQSLTDFGRAYYERCRLILAEAEAADALAADQLAEPRGKLRVTMPVHFGRHCAMPILLALARQYPALDLELSFSDRLTDLAEDGYDLAIRTGSLQDRADTIARRVGRQRMIVCASPAYLGQHGEPQRIDDLRQHHAIVYRRSGPVAPWLFPRGDGPPLELQPAGRLMLDDLDAIADAATEGMGIAWLPSWLVRERIDAGALVQLLPTEPAFLYDAYALWLRTPHLRAQGTACRRCAGECVAEIDAVDQRDLPTEISPLLRTLPQLDCSKRYVGAGEKPKLDGHSGKAPGGLSYWVFSSCCRRQETLIYLGHAVE